MKKVILVACLFVVATFFVMEHKTKEEKPVTLATNEKIEKVSQTEKRAIFVSYIEIGKYLNGKDEKQQKENLNIMLNNLQKTGFNMLIFHVRSASDAIYSSKIFPWSASISGTEGVAPSFDILEYVIEKAHEKKIEVHAWINPYRIRTTTDTSSISKENPAYKWLNTSKVKVIKDKGIFYNPASSEVRELIVSGIKEIIENYDVDGIHFDDYFYPDKEIDFVNYLEYQRQGGTLSLDEYRLDCVNQLVKEVYKVIKKHDKSILFGISPEGNIDNNYELNYADTKRWASEDGYVDYLMPQIYFGFENERKPYIEVVNMWNDVITNQNVKLLPALAFYKVGLVDEYAKSGKNEWLEHDDIMKKEIVVSRNLSNYQGFSLFRYDYLFNEDLQSTTTLKELDNLKELLIN